jgi:thiamine-phosphate pyrophosphorylase
MQASGGADFLTFGPVFPTASKAAFGPPKGLDRLAEVCAAVEVPVFALGGVGADNARACIERGARIACIGAVFNARAATDVAAGARKLASAFVS